MPHEVINLENPSASNNHTSINAKEKEYAETTIIKLPKRLYTKKKRRMRGKTPTRTSTVRIDKDYHIHLPSDSKEIRSNSKLRVSHYLQASSPSIYLICSERFFVYCNQSKRERIEDGRYQWCSIRNLWYRSWYEGGKGNNRREDSWMTERQKASSQPKLLEDELWVEIY